MTGIAIGLVFFAFYRLMKAPPKAVYSKKQVKIIPSPSPLPIGERVRVRGPAAAAPRIAIVLDDFGYNNKNVNAVFNIQAPVTFSILPHHPYSKRIAELAHQKAYEAVLHLPLEPYETDKSIKPEKVTIMSAMKSQEVVAALAEMLKTVPYAKGASNHQGSKATENYELMKVIFTDLKQRHMYFLDSLVTSKSVCKKLARETGIGFGRRDVFLDNKEDFEYIKGQFTQLVKRAKRAGSAIGIGHDRPKTVEALAVLMPEAEKEGVKFVFLSELIK
jgi:polysaccharide deacetylase 2 family uncharacterized protein YibQ